MASEFTAPGRLTSEPDLRPPPLDFAEPAPDEDIIALSYARPFHDEPDYAVGRVARVGLEVAHRAGSLALILLLGGIGALIAGKHAGQLLFWTVGVATLGLLGAAVALFRLGRSPSREAPHVSLFNLIIFIASIALFLIYR